MIKPSIKKNTVANYFGQMYTMLIGIAVTPLYLQYLGAEAYGLVGFFALMQAWMALLDLGLSPTLGRQAAYARGQDNGFDSFKRLLKSFEIIFFVLALIIVLAIYLFSDWIAESWIQAENLTTSTLIYCIVLMGGMIGLRWFAGLYRSGINGLEDQVWLNAANILVITLKFVGALLLLMFISRDVRHFFEYQLVIASVEVIIFALRFYKKLPTTQLSLGLLAFDWITVKNIAPFALSIAYTAGVWVLITQTDKLILSGILTLSEFGYFSLVALVAGGVTTLSGPISQAVLPRLILLFSQGKKQEMLSLYAEASQFVTVISLSVSLMVGLYAETLIYAWTGDRQATEWGAKVLVWFALGNGILAIGAFQYYLQLAFGELKLHVIGSTVSALIQVPVIYYAAIRYGAEGAGLAWFSFRLIWFFVWTPIVHNHLVSGFHLEWLFKKIMPIIVVTVSTGLLIHNLFILDLQQKRHILFIEMLSLGLILLFISGLSVKSIRNRFFEKFNIVK